VKNPGTGLRAHCPTYAGVRSGSDWALGRDVEQERTVGLLLLGKGAVLAHGFDRPLAVEMDDDRQS
jgi:hypothetical protein